jgi:hypothetical protein
LAQIVPVVSEALEAQIRNLLPSQRGFGEDLQASNVIIPIIDLTRAAEGSTTPELLQTALAFGSQTVFEASNSTDVIVNTAGFYRVIGQANVRDTSGSTPTATLQMSDGLTTKNVWELKLSNTSDQHLLQATFDFVFFLNTGDSLSAISSTTRAIISGSSRQIADVNGDLVNPSGFSPQ